jgi:hypothetical protein
VMSQESLSDRGIVTPPVRHADSGRYTRRLKRGSSLAESPTRALFSDTHRSGETVNRNRPNRLCRAVFDRCRYGRSTPLVRLATAGRRGGAWLDELDAAGCMGVGFGAGRLRTVRDSDNRLAASATGRGKCRWRLCAAARPGAGVPGRRDGRDRVRRRRRLPVRCRAAPAVVPRW